MTVNQYPHRLTGSEEGFRRRYAWHGLGAQLEQHAQDRRSEVLGQVVMEVSGPEANAVIRDQQLAEHPCAEEVLPIVKHVLNVERGEA